MPGRVPAAAARPMAAASPSQRIDPAKIPRPPLCTRPQDGALPVYYPRQALEDPHARLVQPPPADSRYLVQDDGNASPDVMRATVYHMPQSRGVWHHTGDVPLGVLCHPMAVPAADYVPLPHRRPDGGFEERATPAFSPAVPWVSALTTAATPAAAQGPPRCSHCQAYVNPFFGQDGRCNMCQGHNRGCRPADEGVRGAQSGTVDWAVDGPYASVRASPVEAVHLYVVDLTCPKVRDYLTLLAQVGRDLAQQGWRQGGSERWKTRIGLCFVCAAGLFVRPHAREKRGDLPAYVVAADVTEDPFCPLPLSEWTFDVSTEEGLELWMSFLNLDVPGELEALLPLARARSAHGQDGLELSCGGAGLAFLADALAGTGGRGTLLTWRRPNYGAGRIPYREEKMNGMRTQGTYTSSTPLQIQDVVGDEKITADFYKQLATRCLKDRVCLDVVYHTMAGVPPPFLDVATLGELCRETCGRLLWVSSTDWKEVLYAELSQSVQVFVGFDAVFKVRCSTGLQVKSFLLPPGSQVDAGLMGSQELELSCVNPWTTIAVQLEHRIGGIPKGQGAFVQAALLYSTPSGERRVRVSTLGLRVTSDVNEVYKSIDFGATASMLMRDSMERLRKTVDGGREEARAKVREGLYHMTVSILANYRLHTNAKSFPPGQLILPDKMQLLPLFCMGLMKSLMLRPSLPRREAGTNRVFISPTADERAFFACSAQLTGGPMALLMAHPYVFTLDTRQESCGVWVDASAGGETTGFVRMPPPLAASVGSLEDDSVYLIDSYTALFLVYGKDVSDDVKQLTVDPSTHEGQWLANLIWQCRRFSASGSGVVRPNYPPVITVSRSEGNQSFSESCLMDLMVDDAMGGGKDYSDFLVDLHRRIADRLQSGK
jgi:protein transport protein SEC24